jgi:hypothetical protein
MIRGTRDLLREHEDRLGDTVEKMARKMEQFGLLAKAAQDLTNPELRAIVSYINNRRDPAGREALETLLRGKERPDLEAVFAEYDRSREATDALYDEPDRVPEAIRIEPVMPPDIPEAWPLEDGPVPREFWSQFQQLKPNYRWEYRPAESDEDFDILSMPLPLADSYQSLRSYSEATQLSRSLSAIPVSEGFVRKLVTTYLKGDLGVAEKDVPERMVKAWMFLIHARTLDGAACDHFYGPVILTTFRWRVRPPKGRSGRCEGRTAGIETGPCNWADDPRSPSK